MILFREGGIAEGIDLKEHYPNGHWDGCFFYDAGDRDWRAIDTPDLTLFQVARALADALDVLEYIGVKVPPLEPGIIDVLVRFRLWSQNESNVTERSGNSDLVPSSANETDDATGTDMERGSGA